MFERHFGLRENPFPAGHQLKFVYPSREHQEARAHLRYGIENREPFLLITGEVGTGKTTSLYDALNEWGNQVAVALITNSALTRQELLEEICLRFGLELQPGISKPAALVMLERHLIGVRGRGERAVLMLDEAQNLSMDLLEEIRLLSNLEHRGEKLLQIFLIGQPELEAHLARHELRQLRQRITVHYRLNPLSLEETTGYIHHHLQVAGGDGPTLFPVEACHEVHRITHGIPREINSLASGTLIAAFAEGAAFVTPQHVATAATEGEFRSVLAPPGSQPVTPPPAVSAAPPVVAPAPAPVLPATPPPPMPAPVPAPVRTEAPLPPPPAPPAPAPVPLSPERRAALSRGLLVAMERAEGGAAAAAPAPAPARPQFATSPRAAVAPTPAAAAAETPTGLSQQLEDELEFEQSNHLVRNWVIGVSVVAVLAIGVILMQRFGAIDLPFLRSAAGTAQVDQPVVPPPAPAPVAIDTLSADSLRSLAMADSVMRADSLSTADSLSRAAAAAAVPVPVPVTPSASRPATTPKPAAPAPAPAVRTPTATAAAPAVRPAATPASPATVVRPTAPVRARRDSVSAPAPTGPHYAVSVAAFLDVDRAESELKRLTAVTGLQGMIQAVSDGGTTMYRVVLGRWGTADDAESAANTLMRRNVVNEALVVRIPRR